MRNHINTILRGFIGGGSSSSIRKHHVQALKNVYLVDTKLKSISPIMFTNEDFKILNPNQGD